MYHLDFFGKGNTSPLDTLIELGKSGFNNLLAKNNVDTYAISLASHHGTTDLFSTLENYRKVFLPDKPIMTGLNHRLRLTLSKKNPISKR